MHALVATVIFTFAALAHLPGGGLGVSSGDLLRMGFRSMAEGDLLTVREFGGYGHMDSGIFVRGDLEPCVADDTLVASIPSKLYRRCGSVGWTEERYDSFVRLKLREHEFVCILGSGETCHWTYGQISMKN